MTHKRYNKSTKQQRKNKSKHMGTSLFWCMSKLSHWLLVLLLLKVHTKNRLCLTLMLSSKLFTRRQTIKPDIQTRVLKLFPTICVWKIYVLYSKQNQNKSYVYHLYQYIQKIKIDATYKYNIYTWDNGRGVKACYCNLTRFMFCKVKVN